MPIKPKKPCGKIGCRRLTTERYCEEHMREYRQQQDRERGTAHERGYDARWRRARAAFLREHPLCRECEREGRITPATVVDHIVPHRGDYERFWSEDNWQSLCAYHHNRKTALEDSNFARRKN